MTVNTAPARAKMVIGRVVEAVKDKYAIIHAGNAEGTSKLAILGMHSWLRSLLPAISEVPGMLEELKPDMLVRLLDFCLTKLARSARLTRTLVLCIYVDKGGK